MAREAILVIQSVLIGTKCIVHTKYARWWSFWLITFSYSLGDDFFVWSLEFQWAPTVLADLFLFSYESDFLDNIDFLWQISSGHRKLARSFNPCFQYINDPIVSNNKKFWKYVKDIYPSQLNVEKTNQSDNLASYFDLTFTIEKEGENVQPGYITNVLTLIST